ncbi:unnamed protein product [Mytilus edulis]|uniref:Uncharacterized protein n=1 Tax=Mytilus edulis TaxID=6550 RepID=A0A8S3RQL8_MYTED|nr:unnamed protein product [Mytilus edulis]
MIVHIDFHPIVKSIILVGSFSECSLVQETIRKTFSTRNVIVPEDSGLAVLKGAVIYGHKKMINSENGFQQRHPPLVDENATLSDDSSTESPSVSSDENAPLCTKDVEDLKTSIPYVPFKEDILLNFDYTERKPMPLFSTIAEENRENNDGQKEISETAINTCETILVGFEMLTSDCILRNGDIAIENFDQTENARQMRKELEKNKILWQHQSTPEAIRLKQVAGVLDAIEKGDYTEILKLYYRAQHQHTFSAKDRPLEIPVYIHRNQLYSKWIPHVEHAIEAINTVTPGINLYKTSNKDRSMIRIGVDSAGESNQAYTTNGSILDKRQNKEYKRPFYTSWG